MPPPPAQELTWRVLLLVTAATSLITAAASFLVFRASAAHSNPAAHRRKPYAEANEEAPHSRVKMAQDEGVCVARAWACACASIGYTRLTRHHPTHAISRVLEQRGRVL